MNMIKDYLYFSGHSSGHGDQVVIKIHDDQSVEVSCYNDGYPNPGGGGGYSLPMPIDILLDYDQAWFIGWLRQSFWKTDAIEIVSPVDEQTVKAFLAKRLSQSCVTGIS